jgi:hypothetical protein
MRSPKIWLVILSLSLLLSNLWWLYRSIDFGVTHTYAMAQCESDRFALSQLEAILPVALNPGHTQEQIVSAVHIDAEDSPFEKEGYLWVGQLGLKFDASGRLAQVYRHK